MGRALGTAARLCFRPPSASCPASGWRSTTWALAHSTLRSSPHRRRGPDGGGPRTRWEGECPTESSPSEHAPASESAFYIQFSEGHLPANRRRLRSCPEVSIASSSHQARKRELRRGAGNLDKCSAHTTYRLSTLARVLGVCVETSASLNASIDRCPIRWMSPSSTTRPSQKRSKSPASTRSMRPVR